MFRLMVEWECRRVVSRWRRLIVGYLRKCQRSRFRQQTVSTNGECKLPDGLEHCRSSPALSLHSSRYQIMRSDDG